MSTQIKHHYNCLGCGKDYNTYKYYPDGWICLDCRKTATITVKCSVCGTNVPVKWETYRMKDPSIPWRCRACNDKYRNEVYAAKPEEERAAFVASQAARSKAYYANLSDDEREAMSQQRKSSWKKRVASGNAALTVSAMKVGRKKWYDSLSKEEKHQNWVQRNEGRAIWWASLTPEEQAAHMKFPHEGFSRWYKSLSLEEQKAFMGPIWKGNKEFWNSMTPAQYREWKSEFNKGYAEYLRRVDPHNKNVQPNKNELDLINRLLVECIPYIFQYPSHVIHPDFVKLFPNNPVTGADLVDPTHSWDFLLCTHGGDVLVDIDGSMHFNDTYVKKHPYTGKVYKELDYKKFNDSQRPYQTDGLPAYIIQCYDDNLTDNTIVENVATGEKMAFRQWMSVIRCMNMTDAERKTFMNDVKSV